jgi:hypothetical protein
VTGVKTLYLVTYQKTWGARRMQKTVLLECLPPELSGYVNQKEGK